MNLKTTRKVTITLNELLTIIKDKVTISSDSRTSIWLNSIDIDGNVKPERFMQDNYILEIEISDEREV